MAAVAAMVAGSVFCIADTALSGRLVWFLADSDKRPEAPNVILVVVDALRADHLTQYGYRRDTSVGLDRFAAQATRFDSAFAPSSWTTPSTTSILTGLHPARHKATFKGATLNPRIRTLAELLRQAGYDTAGFSYNVNITDRTNHQQGFDHFAAPTLEGHATFYSDISSMVDEVQDWVDYHGRKRPFFLYMQPMNCHGPYKVPRQRQSDLLGRRPSREFRYYGSPMSEIMLKGRVEERRKVKPSYKQSLLDQYDTAVRYTTDTLAAFFRWLSEENMWENAMVIVVSDHGEELFDHGGFSHGYSLYDEVVRVPFFVKLPYQQKRTVSRKLVSLMDIYPSVADALGIRFRHRIDGASFLPFLRRVNADERIEIPAPPRHAAKRHLLLSLDWPGRGVMAGSVDSRTKYIRLESDYSGATKRRLLFDRREDPHESRNRAGAEEERVKKLESAFRHGWKVYSQTAFDAPKSALKKMDIDRLKALGYIQ